MKFKFTGRDAAGQEVSGTREAVDRFSLSRALRAEGVTVVEARPVEKTGPSFFTRFNFFNRVSFKDRIFFATSLSSMLTAGLPLSRALGVMERQSRRPVFRKVLSGILEKITAGTALHRALADYPDVFPAVFVAMIRAGEESGQLPQSLKIIKEQLEKSYGLRRKIIGALIYPAIVLTAMIVVGALLMVYLVPTLTALFAEFEAELPLSTRLVIALSNFLANNTALALLTIFIAGVLLWLFFRSSIGRRFFTIIFLHLPVFGTLTRNLNSAVTMRTLASLIASGINMVEALSITKEVLSNYYYQQVMRRGAAVVEKGGALSALFKENEKFYPALVAELTEVGEETGNLSGMLMNGAVFYEEEVDQTSKNLSAVVEPFLMVLVGLGVGFFAVAMIGPMYSVTSSIKF